jgi:uncharacterized protein (DUF2062 family)
MPDRSRKRPKDVNQLGKLIVENHALSVALHYFHYNFCRIHTTLRVTPAMAAGVTDHVWDMSDLAALIAAREAPHGEARAVQEKGSLEGIHSDSLRPCKHR